MLLTSCNNDSDIEAEEPSGIVSGIFTKSELESTPSFTYEDEKYHYCTALAFQGDSLYTVKYKFAIQNGLYVRYDGAEYYNYAYTLSDSTLTVQRDEWTIGVGTPSTKYTISAKGKLKKITEGRKQQLVIELSANDHNSNKICNRLNYTYETSNKKLY